MRFSQGGAATRFVAALMAMGAFTLPASPAHAAPLTVSASGANGVGRANVPGLPCAAGGDGASWHYGYEAALPADRFTSLASSLRLNLDVHGDDPGSGPLPDGPNGFLRGTESTAALVNERGTVVLRLSDGGSCEHRTASLTATDVRTSGTWTVEGGSGSFRSAAGGGGFTVQAGIAPGADNPWSLDLNGSITVAQPSLEVTQVGTYWGALGADYLTRRPTVVLRVTNTGAGDAFGVRLTGAASTTSGVTLLSGAPARLGDLLAGQSTDVVLRYQLGLVGPCAAVILNCQFEVQAVTAATDALDAPAGDVDRVAVTTPLLAPPL